MRRIIITLMKIFLSKSTMRKTLNFFASEENNDSIMKLLIFLLSLPVIFHITYNTFLMLNIDWTGISIYAGVVLGVKAGQKLLENKNQSNE